MAWIVLVIAGLLEVSWAVGMKLSDNFTRLGWSIFTVVTLLASMGMLWWAVNRLPLGTAYAVWTGIGAVGTAIIGILLFSESVSIPRLFCLGMVVAGVIGLRLFES